MVKNLPAMQEIQVQSLGWKDPLEKEMATHSSVLAWEILWAEKPGGLPSMGSHRVRHDSSDLAAAANIQQTTTKHQLNKCASKQSLDPHTRDSRVSLVSQQ